MPESLILIMGPKKAGKTALRYRYYTNHFEDNFDPTIEETIVDKQILYLTIDDGIEGLEIAQYKSGDGFICLFDCTDTNSFTEAVKIRDEIVRLRGDLVPLVFVGTKSDLLDRVKGDLSNAIKGDYIRVSSKTGENVEQVFMMLFKMLVQVQPKPLPHPHKCSIQ